MRGRGGGDHRERNREKERKGAERRGLHTGIRTQPEHRTSLSAFSWRQSSLFERGLPPCGSTCSRDFSCRCSRSQLPLAPSPRVAAIHRPPRLFAGPLTATQRHSRHVRSAFFYAITHARLFFLVGSSTCEENLLELRRFVVVAVEECQAMSTRGGFCD